MTDDNLYDKKQEKWLAEFEALCKRCGACCGIETDPCSNLVKSPDGGYTCKAYDERLGPQKTVTGKAFTCVPINEVINKGMPHSSCGYITRVISFFVLLFFSFSLAYCDETAISPEDLTYRKFKLDKETCDVAVIYRDNKDGADVAISAIAMGKGANFRKWLVTDVRLRAGEERIRPDDYGKFYVRQESYFRLPAVVLFAALGTQVPISGSSLSQGIGKTGAAIGLGLLAWMAKGDIEGYKCLFRLNKDAADKIKAGRVFAEIKVENKDEHLEDTIKIGIAKRTSRDDNKEKYEKMGQDELAKLIAHLGWRVKTLEGEQAAYKYGVDPQYDEIQFKIEDLETQRAIAHDIWSQKLEKK